MATSQLHRVMGDQGECRTMCLPHGEGRVSLGAWGRFVQSAGQASRALSTARLKASLPLHLPPINVVVSHGPSGGSCPREDSSSEGLPT